MSKRGRKGDGSFKLRRRKDGTLAMLMKVTIGGVDHVRTIDAPGRKQMRDKLRDFATEVRSGAFAADKVERAKFAGQPTLAEWSPLFLSGHVSLDEDRQATRTAYGNMMRLYIVPALGTHKLSEITTPMVREALQAMYRSGGQNGRGLAMGTIKLVFAVFSRCFEAAKDDGYLQANPVPRFSKLKLGDVEGPAESAKRHALSKQEVAALLDACRDDASLHLWVSIMAASGLRPGEANGLRWRDVDVKANALHVRGSAKHVYSDVPGEAGRVWIGKPKTPSSLRTVTIGPALAAALASERERQERMQRELRGLDPAVRHIRTFLPADACVFPADVATEDALCAPVSPDRLAGQFRRAAGRAGLKVSPHWLRHTAISHAIAEGTPLADASKRAGHKSPAVTAAIYTHAVGEGQSKAAAIGDSMLLEELRKVTEL